MLVLFPDSSLRTSKRRPALVVQADGLGIGLDQTVLALLSSNITRAKHRSRVLIRMGTPEGKASGLKQDSVIMTDNLRTVRHELIDRVIGHLPDMTAVDAALRHTLGL